jgi:orotate phosphoribosyltransferase
MSDLLQLIIDAGLVQFGRFASDGSTAPVQFHLDMLASYPDVLEAAAKALSSKIPSTERLLCISEALPLGVALALKTGIPLIYSRGGEKEPVYDLVGAYDIGHPTTLVVNIAGQSDYGHLLTSARRVGLDVQSVAAVINVGAESELPLTSLLHLSDVVDTLHERGILPHGQAIAVRAWIEGRVAEEK